MAHCFILTRIFEVISVIYNTKIQQLKAPRHEARHVHVTTLPVPCPFFQNDVDVGKRNAEEGARQVRSEHISYYTYRLFGPETSFRVSEKNSMLWKLDLFMSFQEVLRQFIHIVFSEIKYI